MEINGVKANLKEIQRSGRLGIYLNTTKTAQIGTTGEIVLSMTPRSNGELKVIRQPFEVVEPDTKKKVYSVPNSKVEWVDYTLPEHESLWKELVDFSCFKELDKEEQAMKVSYQIVNRKIDDEEIIMIYVNKRFPEYVSLRLKYSSERKKNILEKFVEQQLKEICTISAVNPYFKKSNSTINEECSLAITEIENIYKNNILYNICFKASMHIVEKRDRTLHDV